MLIALERLLEVLLEAAGLFVVATFVFDAIHFSLHVCLKSRYRWLRKLASPHEAHHAFFDRRLRYHEEVTVPNLVHHVIPEYATQMAVCSGFDRTGPAARRDRGRDLHRDFRKRDDAAWQGLQPHSVFDHPGGTRDAVRAGALPRHAPRLSR